ncbi:(E)-4-hydroxy-3-methylbut-2-enyl-diphosphate synthase [bacterium]|nr:(E)-4-hydroxy-3-methylbut-2-enyl-diphosphate synthase [bacterium]
MEVLVSNPLIVQSHRKTKYCDTVFSYSRRSTREVMVGDVGIGGSNPIRIQSMTTTDTMDTAGTVRQVIELYDAGCEIVRVTAPSIRDAENLKNIREELIRQKIRVPLVADIHFTPNAAMKAAEFVEKVRINPGNYADKKKFAVVDYSDLDYERELDRIEETFKPLVLRCKEYGIAMRIGTNHGSLSDRIMNRYGDTPLGMVESALEFVSICERYGYKNIVLSMKSSNVQVMIAAYRLLASRMYELKMDYPFHLGVTEAGDGEDGRIKSAIGIGALLEDGLGDTIRVSLTENSVFEIPAARAIAGKYYGNIGKPSFTDAGDPDICEARDPFQYGRRWSQTVELPLFNLGGVHHVRVELPLPMPISHTEKAFTAVKNMSKAGIADAVRAEIVRIEVNSLNDVQDLQKLYALIQNHHIPVAISVRVKKDLDIAKSSISHCDILHYTPGENVRSEIVEIISLLRVFEKKALHLEAVSPDPQPSLSQTMSLAEEAVEYMQVCFDEDFSNCSVSILCDNTVHANRILAAKLHAASLKSPIKLHHAAKKGTPTLFESSIQLGSLLCDGIGDCIYIEDPDMKADDLIRLNYNILQAARLRISKTEFISCPSCGRTLFDLQEVTARIKSKTEHLKGVKIAIMGCIVNGPGEMADADFGYVGSSAGKINLYVGKKLIERNIDMADADQRLIELIKSEGMWNEPK